MEWGSFFKNQLPTLIIIALLFYFGASLVNGNTMSNNIPFGIILGGILFLLGFILATFAYADYKNKEHIDLLNKSYKSTVTNFDTMLKSFTKNRIAQDKPPTTMTRAAEVSVPEGYTPIGNSGSTPSAD